MIFYRPVPEFSCGGLCHTGNSFSIRHVPGHGYHHTALTAPGIGREVGAFAGAQRGLGATRERPAAVVDAIPRGLDLFARDTILSRPDRVEAVM